jgi:hypothetical protein
VVISEYFVEEDFGGYQLHSNIFEGVFSNEAKAKQYIKKLEIISNSNEVEFDAEPITYTIYKVKLDNDTRKSN